MNEDELDALPTEEAPFGVKLLTCLLLADAVRGGVDLALGARDGTTFAPMTIFVMRVVIDLLLALLLVLRTRAGRYWTQAILVLHVIYMAQELGVRVPHVWLAMGVATRLRVVATVFMEGGFVAYLGSQKAAAWLDDGP